MFSCTKTLFRRSKCRICSVGLNNVFTLVVVVFVSASLRLYCVFRPNIICWDELHYAKMSTWYIERKFFFDIHPPFGKILLALCGILNGYKGGVAFEKTCDAYDEHFPYIQLRVFCSWLSSLLPVFCLFIVWNMTASLRASLITVVLVVFDTGLVLIGRLILLESLLMFFMFCSFACFVKSQTHEMLSTWHINWLTLSGIFLGFEMSVKMNGIFTMLFYVTKFFCNIWSILPDKSNSLSTLVKLCAINILCIIIIPTTIYIVTFMIHFGLLLNSGPGDSLFSIAFQSQLRGNIFNNLVLPKYVSYDGDIVIRNIGKKGYLSHPQRNNCQEINSLVTTFASLDEGSIWKFRTIFYDGKHLESIRYVADGDVVQLQHSRSMNLLGTTISSSFTGTIDVTCTNQNDTGHRFDGNRYFRIILDKTMLPYINLINLDHDELKDTHGNSILQPMKHAFYLMDIDNDCFLESLDKRHRHLQWHREVTCNLKNTNQHTLWYVELSRDERVEKVQMRIQQMNFWQKLLELHVVMFKAHGSLEAESDKSRSFPWQWPLNIPGQSISGPEYIMYLIGTPLSWWTSTANLIIFVLVLPIISVIERRNNSPVLSNEMQNLMISCRWIFMAWVMHFFPFFLMSRVLYFHHYLPAAIFKFMLAGIGAHCMLRLLEDYKVHRFIILSILTACLAIIIQNFCSFSSLSYGLNLTEDTSESVLNSLRWIRNWNF